MTISRILRPLLLVLAVFILVWVCVVFWWKVAEIQPTGRQMVLWLAVLPAGLLCGWWLSRALVRRMRRTPSTSVKNVETGALLANNDGSGDGPAYRLDLPITALCLPVGSDPDSVLDALRQPAVPRLHPSLKDHSGLPVFAAFADELDVGHWHEVLERSSGNPVACTEEQTRAMALLEPVVEHLFQQLLALLPQTAEAEQQVVAGLRRVVDSTPTETVRVSLLLSQGWPPTLRQAAGDWLLARAAEMGFNAVARLSFETVPVAGAIQVWRYLDGIGKSDQAATDWHVVVACDSLVGERSIDALQAAGLLMGGNRPEGILPGEGAAGLVLRMASEDAGDAACLQTIVQAPAPNPPQARAAARAGSELMLRASTMAGVEPAELAFVISDADQRPSCVVEASVSAAQAFTELDLSQQCIALGAACGHLGHVAPLALLSVASALVQREGRAVLAFGVSGAHERAAVIVSPHPQPTQDTGATPDTST